MKLTSMRYPASLTSIVLALSATEIQAGTMGPVQTPATEKVYFGIFAGGGTSNKVNINQYGTAFFPEANGGPLAVNSFGHTNSRTAGIVGGHIGYQWRNIFLNSLNTQASMTPAIELEGYYVGKSSFSGHDLNNDTTRLPEHDFLVTYPMSTGVFLANTVLNFNSSNYASWHPYVGAGIGAAVLAISQADSLQLAPIEANVNHYNGNPNDTVAAFAAQAKVGLNYSFSEHLSVFAEYRLLYIANSSYTFGSTVYPSHVPTSSWSANLGSQNYNLGAGGIRFTV